VEGFAITAVICWGVLKLLHNCCLSRRAQIYVVTYLVHKMSSAVLAKIMQVRPLPQSVSLLSRTVVLDLWYADYREKASKVVYENILKGM
jgi:hypothetical protein